MTVYKLAGTTLKVDGTACGQLTELSGPSYEIGTVETTDLSSSFKTFVSTVVDSGEVTFTINYDSANAEHVVLEGLAHAPVNDTEYTITFNDGTSGSTIVFDGIMTNLEFTGGTVEDLMAASVTVKITGETTFTPSS